MVISTMPGKKHNNTNKKGAIKEPDNPTVGTVSRVLGGERFELTLPDRSTIQVTLTGTAKRNFRAKKGDVVAFEDERITYVYDRKGVSTLEKKGLLRSSVLTTTEKETTRRLDTFFEKKEKEVDDEEEGSDHEFDEYLGISNDDFGDGGAECDDDDDVVTFGIGNGDEGNIKERLNALYDLAMAF